MIMKMGDAVMDLVDGVDTTKKLWSRLRAYSILFQKLVHLKLSNSEATGNNVGKIYGLS